MSVPRLDTPASTLTPPDHMQTRHRSVLDASRPAPSAPSFNGQSTATVSFPPGESRVGPLFGNQPPLSEAGRFHQDGASVMLGFMALFKQWMSQWFGGRPPSHCPSHSNPPPRPDPSVGKPPPRPSPTVGRPFPTYPGKPDPSKSNEQLAQRLLDNFSAFRDPKKPGFVSVDSLHAMAKRPLSSDPVMNENIRLARELLRRPELIDAIDRHSTTGALDGLIDRQKLKMIINGDNYFKYKSDKELAGAMLEHFDELKGSKGQALKINDLKKLAAQPLTGDSPKDHLIQLAREIIQRSDVLKIMDNLAGKDNDGRISLEALYRLSR